MAKISNINIGITGDSSGLVSAADKATNSIRKVAQETEKTKKAIGDFRKQTEQVGGSLSKLGVAGGGGLDALAGITGLAGLGGMGLATAGIGLAVAGITKMKEGLDGVQAQAEAARKALDEVAAGKGPIERFGFTTEGARALAAIPQQTAPTFGSAFGSMFALGSQQTGQNPNAPGFWDSIGPTLGTIFGAMAAGGLPDQVDFEKSMGRERAQYVRSGIEEHFPIIGGGGMMLMGWMSDLGNWFAGSNSK